MIGRLFTFVLMLLLFGAAAYIAIFAIEMSDDTQDSLDKLESKMDSQFQELKSMSTTQFAAMQNQLDQLKDDNDDQFKYQMLELENEVDFLRSRQNSRDYELRYEFRDVLDD